MGLAHHSPTIGGISRVTKSYWIENMHLSFIIFIESTHDLNGIE